MADMVGGRIVRVVALVCASSVLAEITTLGKRDHELRYPAYCGLIEPAPCLASSSLLLVLSRCVGL